MPKPTAKKSLKSKNTVPAKPRSAKKSDLVEQVRSCVENYSTLYIFDLVNSRTSLLKKIREEFKQDGRFIFGKTKVMQIALGRNSQEALRPNLDKFGKELSGSSTVGLFFTNSKPVKIEKKFSQISELDYARAGYQVEKTVELKAGPIIGQPSSMLEPLRGLKLPVVLQKGVIELESDYVVCNSGDVLNIDQARVLKLFGVMLSEFKIVLKFKWFDNEITQLYQE